MKQEFLSQLAQSPLLLLPLVALLLFIAVFATWVLLAYGRPAEAYAKISSLPLEDDAPRAKEARGENSRSLELDHVR